MTLLGDAFTGAAQRVVARSLVAFVSTHGGGVMHWSHAADSSSARSSHHLETAS